jgi:hypothetical protein
MADIIQLRRDLASEWTSVNPILTEGEFGVELDTGKVKIGNGVDVWTALPYRLDVGGASGAVQYNNGSGGLAGSANIAIHDDDLCVTKSDNPTAPPVDNAKFFARSVAGRIMPAFIGPSGLDSVLQPFLARNKIAYWNPPGNATTVPGVFGFSTFSVTGTSTARNVAVTNILTRMKRTGYLSAATAGALCGGRFTALQFTTGDVSGLGGFHFIKRFGISDPATVTGARMFVGLRSTGGAPTNVEPSTILNCIGVGQLSSDDTQLYIIYGGSTAQAPIALGSTNFSIDTNTAYEIALFSPSGVSGVVNWQVTNLGNGQRASGQILGNAVVVPQSTTLLTINSYRTNNATALEVGLDVCSMYMETDT